MDFQNGWEVMNPAITSAGIFTGEWFPTDTKRKLYGGEPPFGMSGDLLNDIMNFCSNKIGFFPQKFYANLTGPGRLVFPGGKSFVFKNVQFSDNYDLIGQITYADPT